MVDVACSGMLWNVWANLAGRVPGLTVDDTMMVPVRLFPPFSFAVHACRDAWQFERRMGFYVVG